LIGQGVLYVLAGRNREQNFAYRILKTVTSPVFALARLIAPRFFVQEYLWALAPAIVLVLWVLFTYLKIRLVLMAA
ncbi:MAG: hypothetical protein NZU63_15090, partial [Gemmataceae bacterium]|nr:hypothetical protein [Gemmataceae bacterium]